MHEKAANNLAGLVIMGVRMYNPVTGLFSSPDPVYQGNANPYVYPSDPINATDLGGMKAGPVAQCAEMLPSCGEALQVWKESNTGNRVPWRGLITGAEFVGAGVCLVAASGFCELGLALGSFFADTAVTVANDHGNPLSLHFVGQESFAVVQSLLFALPGSAIDKGLISTDPLWITLIGRGTGASPAIVDQWATHR